MPARSSMGSTPGAEERGVAMSAVQSSSCGVEKPVLDFVLRAMTTFALPDRLNRFHSMNRCRACQDQATAESGSCCAFPVFISAAQVVAHGRRRDCHALRNLL